MLYVTAIMGVSRIFDSSGHSVHKILSASILDEVLPREG